MTTKNRIACLSTFLNQGSRPVQEDHILADRNRGIFMVADGFGGAKAGSDAAQQGCDAVKNFLFKQAGDQEATLPFILRKYFSLAGNVLYNSLIYANQKINALNKGKNINEKGGVSLLAAYLDQNLLALANVGSCSAHLFRQGQCVELVTPRSYGKSIDPFSITTGSVSEYGAPLIALGMAEDLEPEIFEYRLQAQDWVLLHSDGITQETLGKLKKLHEGQSSNDNVESLSQQAITALNQESFNDNASLVLAIVS